MTSMRISFEGATVTNCDYIGRTVWGVCAVVRDADGREIFRSRASVKRIGPRTEAEQFIRALEERNPANGR